MSLSNKDRVDLIGAVHHINAALLGIVAALPDEVKVKMADVVENCQSTHALLQRMVTRLDEELSDVS